jgi:hypothetical protein
MYYPSVYKGVTKHKDGNDTTRVINSGFTQLKWGLFNKMLSLITGCRYDNYDDCKDYWRLDLNITKIFS